MRSVPFPGVPALRRAVMNHLRDRLKAAGLLPTRQRLALAGLLFSKGDRHVTAEELLLEARRAGLSVSRATVYNTLHAFRGHGLLREIPVEAGRSYFDTNITHACHLYFEDTGTLHDLPAEWTGLQRLSERLGGIGPERLNVVVHVRTLPEASEQDLGKRKK